MERNNQQQQEKRRKESILDLSKYLEKVIRVKFAGGREVSGVLKGFDPLLNLVLDNTTEFLRDPGESHSHINKFFTRKVPRLGMKINLLKFEGYVGK